MKIGMIALTAALLMLAIPAWAGAPGPCDLNPTDSDSDTVCDDADNCLDIINVGVSGCDTDDDGYGNVCDGDFDNNGLVSSGDFTAFWLSDFTGGSGDQGTGTDMDCNGLVSSGDFTAFWLPQFAGGLGASGLSCAGTSGCSSSSAEN
jgi:hypothetical protein